MTEPETPERKTVEFFYSLASALAMTAQQEVIPLMALPPREPGAGPRSSRGPRPGDGRGARAENSTPAWSASGNRGADPGQPR